MFKSLFHRHKWEVIREAEVNDGYTHRYIVIYRCSECNKTKVKKFRL